ncbi:MAG: hypothetical protein ACE5GE_14505, partial [Phycisphaerae bacterium]
MYALSHILVGVTLAVVPSLGQVEQDADPMQVMEQARELAKDGQDEEALAKLLWCYDEGAKESPSFRGARISFLSAQIAELGKKYPPALEALQERRDAAELRADKTKGTHRYLFDLMELAALNHYVGEDAANLELYDELKRETPDSPVLRLLLHFVADELVRAGRVDEAREASMVQGELRAANRAPAVVERAWPRDPAAFQDSGSAVRPTTAYSLDNVQHEQDLAASRDEGARLEVLKRRWNDVVLAATYFDVVTDMSLFSSSQHWQSGWLSTGTWTVRADGDLTEARDGLNKATVLVTGDCQADVTIGGGGMVHIYGDLDSTLTLSGHGEVVIGGDVTADGSVEGDGIVRIFVGGNVDGRISNKGSSTLWINGDVAGILHAGRPVAQIHVIGDFAGQLLPFDVASLAYLDV